MDQLAQCLDLTEHTGRCIHMSDSKHLVFLLLQGLFHLIKLWSVANWCLELCRLDTVCLEAIRERVGEVASV